jgi:predicted hotdog family 3-hydroxylacyl-ACP dehydratase
MKTTDLQIEDLLPHRDRLKLISEIIELEDETAVTRSVVSPAWPTAGSSGVDPVMLIELAAQTAAVCIGARRKRQGKRSASLGWIVGIKSADFLTDIVPFQAVLVTRVRQLYGLESYSVFEGTVETGGRALARIQLQVFGEEHDEEAKESHE